LLCIDGIFISLLCLTVCRWAWQAPRFSFLICGKWILILYCRCRGPRMWTDCTCPMWI